ncbi:MAG: Tim44 domain-containing protein [Proteobacteria bacterium]|nr:Tim44 domain-containing protein [Pseudomonadota bacterium]
MAFLDLVLLGAIAIFLGYRLWVVLGTHEKDKPIRKRQSKEEDVVIPVRARASAPVVESSQNNTAVANMDEDRFLQGANIAFRKIVDAYAMGDIAVLKKLLDGPLLETFEDAIEKRKKARKNLEVDISRIVTSEIIDKREEKDITYITVRFVSEQCLVTRNGKGKVMEGDPDRYSEVTDIWTFSRPHTHTDPNWKLVATQVPEA